MKIWKRDICEINHLINGLITLLTRINEQDIENSFEINLMASYGFGDLLHHMVEYLPFMRFNDLDNDQEIVEQNLNNLKILNTTVMRENLIFLSIFFYRKVVSNENSRNRQYINLSRLRLIELSHALISKFNDVPIQKIIDFNNELENEEEIISDIEQYYKWAKVPNGIGNAYLTRGVSYFYKHDYQNARANLDKAKEFYMGDEVGEYKCNIYLQRMRKPDIL